jgi:hypothetical protein
MDVSAADGNGNVGQFRAEPAFDEDVLDQSGDDAGLADSLVAADADADLNTSAVSCRGMGRDVYLWP